MTYPKRKLLKWNMMSTFEKETILDEFWEDYFNRYPETGISEEVNTIRKRFRPFLRPYTSNQRAIRLAVHDQNGRCVTCKGIHLAGSCPMEKRY